MSYFLFLDESGQDHTNSPYEVLAGIAIEDASLWNFISRIHELELAHFGRRYSEGLRELKAKKILKSKTFRLAAQASPMDPDHRRTLAKQCLDLGESANKEKITALAQAKLEFVKDVLVACLEFDCRAFASIVPWNAPRPTDLNTSHLRKDYSYLFERFYYFLEDKNPKVQGIVVFDELEKTKSHLLVDQMHRYFQRSIKGNARASQLIPEPFFVHSELSTGVQVADLVAYIMSWGMRHGQPSSSRISELKEYADLVNELRYVAVRKVKEKEDFKVYSFAYIADLNPKEKPKEG